MWKNGMRRQSGNRCELACMRVSLVSLAAAWISCATAFPGDLAIDLSRHPLRNLTIPLYEAAQPRPVAVLRIGEVRLDYQRRGFFRIGLLPLVVVDEVRIDLGSASDPLDALGRACRRLDMPHRTDAIELRRVTVRFPSSPQSQLQAARVRFGQEGQWHISDGAVWEDGTKRVEASRGCLHLSGALAGQIVLDTSPSPSAVAMPNLSASVPPNLHPSEPP